MTTLTDRGRTSFLQALRFAASVEIGSGEAIVRLDGELDLSSHEQCCRYVEEIATATALAIVLDLSRLSFIDGRGLARLAESARRARRPAQPVRFVIPPGGPIRRVVDVLRTIDDELWVEITGNPAGNASETVPPRLPRRSGDSLVGLMSPQEPSSTNVAAAG